MAHAQAHRVVVVPARSAQFREDLRRELDFALEAVRRRVSLSEPCIPPSALAPLSPTM